MESPGSISRWVDGRWGIMRVYYKWKNKMQNILFPWWSTQSSCVKHYGFIGFTEIPQRARYREEHSLIRCILFGLRNKPSLVPKVENNSDWHKWRLYKSRVREPMIVTWDKGNDEYNATANTCSITLISIGQQPWCVANILYACNHYCWVIQMWPF